MDAIDVQPEPDAGPDATAAAARDAARERLRGRRDFVSHLVAFVVVNGFMIAIWAATGGGYFWPAWLLGTWGIGLVLHAWDVYLRRPITESDVDAEVERSR